VSSDSQIEDIFKAMDAKRAVVVERACRAMGAKRDVDTRVVLQLQGIDRLVSLMAEFRGNADVQEAACMALCNVLRASAEAKTRIAEAGGIERVMSAMDDHEELAGVQLAACNLLLPLSSEKQVQDAIRSAGGGDRVRRAMAAASADPLLTATVGPALLLRILDGASQSTVGQEREAVAARGEGRPAPAERKATAVQDKHAKLCLDPAGLVRKGKFGGIRLFDSLLSDAIGFMASSVGRAMYAEHVMAAGSQVAFSPPKHPNYTTTPEQEWYFVVGVDGIDQETFELKPDGRPTCREGSMFPGRNAKRVADLMEMPQAQRAGLTGFEIVALRLYSGAMYARYNTILRDSLPEEEDAQSNSGRADADANLFPTTIHAIV
jgi:hypothetical protein